MHYLSLLFFILAGVYTVWDSLRRGRSYPVAILWGLGVTFLFFIFFPLHLKTRPNIVKNSTIDITQEAMIACNNCGKFCSQKSTICPHCGNNLKNDD